MMGVVLEDRATQTDQWSQTGRSFDDESSNVDLRSDIEGKQNNGTAGRTNTTDVIERE
jgi:hypothetical protein